MTNVLNRVLESLWVAEGKPEREGDDDILGELVRMMLAQATSNANAGRAFENLLDRFHGDWGAIERAPTDDVVAAIEVGGLARQKAPRLQSLLAQVHTDFGEYSLEALREREPHEALAYLVGLDGVGPTTATYALMDAAGMHLFPINGGVRRTLERIGVLQPGTGDAEAHRYVLELLEGKDAYAAHVALVVHARTTCVARAPRCGACVLADDCAFARSR